MARFRPDRPYLDAWLRRLARELSASGALSQTAQRLATDLGGESELWRTRLSAILAGRESPSIDLVTHMDALWSKPSVAPASSEAQGFLF